MFVTWTYLRVLLFTLSHCVCLFLHAFVVSVYDDDDTENGDLCTSPQHVTSASVIRRQWTPKESTDFNLEDDGDNDRKRLSSKDRTYGSGLYPGRGARKGEGQSSSEVKATGKGEGDSQGKAQDQGNRMSQIVEELADNTDTNKKAGLDKDSVTKEQVDVEKDSNSGQVSNRTGVDGLGSEKQHSQKEKVKVKSRPSSYKSDASYTSLTSTHAPSIITIQRYSPSMQPRIEEKLFKPYRRKSFSHDLEKAKHKDQKNRRSSVEDQDMKKKEGMMIEVPIAAPTPETKSPYNQQFMFDGNLNWTVNEAEVIKDQEDTIWDLGVGLDDVKSESSESREGNAEDVQDVDDIESAIIDNEEYVLDNIQECNDEIKQIEAQAGADTDSDSESSMDEEVIKVVLDSQDVKNDVVDSQNSLPEEQETFAEDTADVSKVVKPELRRQSAFDDVQDEKSDNADAEDILQTEELVQQNEEEQVAEGWFEGWKSFLRALGNS